MWVSTAVNDGVAVLAAYGAGPVFESRQTLLPARKRGLASLDRVRMRWREQRHHPVRGRPSGAMGRWSSPRVMAALGGGPFGNREPSPASVCACTHAYRS